MSDKERDAARVGLGRAIELRRVQLGYKRKDLAERASLSYPYISELEKGGKEPSAKALRQIAEALHLGVAELVALGEEFRDGGSPGVVPTDRLPPPLGDVFEMRVPRALGDAASSGLATGASSGSGGDAATELEVLVRRIVRSEIERYERDELPTIIARSVRRALEGREGEADRR